MILFQQSTVLTTQDAIVNFPVAAGSFHLESGWSVGAGLSLFSGTFGPKEERSVHAVVANVATLAASSANAVDMSLQVGWTTGDFNGATTLVAIVVGQLNAGSNS